MDIKLIEPAHDSVTGPLQRSSLCMEDELNGGSVTLDLPVSGDPGIYPGDRSLPAPVAFRWEADCDSCRGITYRLEVSTEPALTGGVKLEGLTRNWAEVYHLCVATRYYWQVNASIGGKPAGKSHVNSFVTSAQMPRWINVPGLTNVRDLGGWPLPGGKRVRQGMVYRGSEMNSHLSITEEGRRVMVEDLGIRTDLDLRREDAHPALDIKSVDWVNIPVLPYGYITEDEQKDAYRRIFELFARPDAYPVFFHCWGGADRAGTLAFLLNAILGVSFQDLARDYEFTSLSLWGARSRESAEFNQIMEELSAYAPPGDIGMRVRNYLLSAGLDPGQIEKIKSILTTGQEV